MENIMTEMRLSKQCRISLIDNHQMHYMEMGEGDPILFLHGMPTSGYLWRNIMPAVADQALCIAPDLMGMGQSDQPNIDYRIFDHIRYIEALIEKLKLKNITLVMHGWGSVIGFDYARRHPENIKGLSFFEAHVRPTREWEMLSLPMQQFLSHIKSIGCMNKAIIDDNILFNQLLPSESVVPIEKDTFDRYNEPFKETGSRQPLLQYIKDLPDGDGPTDVIDLICNYSNWLLNTGIPKLMYYAVPGFMTTIDTVSWVKNNFKNCQLAELPNALHLAQEIMPERFSRSLKDWYQTIQ